MNRENNFEDISATFQHVYTTKFILDDSDDYIRMSEMNLNVFDRIFFVVDKNVFKIYRDILINKFGIESDKVFFYLVEPMEFSKSIEFYPKLVEFLECNSAGRYDAIVAVGGGIIIDLVGFIVSTYMRGLPFFIIATTLIGQTDASTAGKTCLNTVNTKNLLGTFYYPAIVYNSIAMLSTCTKRITRQGLSEAFKYSLLTDGGLLPLIIEFSNKCFDSVLIKEIVKKTIQARIQIRKIDPLASNLGHTFGHALEKYFDYKILHGDAIIIGTIMANNYAVEKSLMSKESCDKILSMMVQAHLNVWIDEELDVKKVIDYMRKDKKSSVNKLHLVLLRDIGHPYKKETPFYEADYTDVEDFLERFISRYDYKCNNYVQYLQREIL